MTSNSRALAASMTAMALIWAAPAEAQNRRNLYDCVIEPVLVTELGSQVSGVIDEILVDRGDVVTAGTVVARLRSEIEEATLEMARSRAGTTLPVDIARSRANLARKELDRAAELHRRAVAATATLDKAVTENQQAVLALKLAEHEMHLAVLEMNRAEAILSVRTIKSPVDGIVMKRMMARGEHVHEQTKLVRIAQVDPLYVEVYLPIGLYRHVRLGMIGEVRPVEPVGGVHDATVTVVDKVFDSASDTFGVRLTLSNPGSTMPGGINCKVGFPEITN